MRYVAKDLRPVVAETSFITEHEVLAGARPQRILDVGCGPGHVLLSILDSFPGSTGVGVEPSPESAARLEERHGSDPRLEFVNASAHDLPFPTDSFDLVVCWSVLHWVGRNEYLQALGELVRVCGGHLVVMDLAAGLDYRTPYRYDERFFTYKADFVAPILASGIVSLVDDQRWVIDSTGARRSVALTELAPFIGNPLSYEARRACLFRKDYAALPVQTADDFDESRRTR